MHERELALCPRQGSDEWDVVKQALLLLCCDVAFQIRSTTTRNTHQLSHKPRLSHYMRGSHMSSTRHQGRTCHELAKAFNFGFVRMVYKPYGLIYTADLLGKENIVSWLISRLIMAAEQSHLRDEYFKSN